MTHMTTISGQKKMLELTFATLMHYTDINKKYLEIFIENVRMLSKKKTYMLQETFRKYIF
jgi:hypothetical protein